MISEISSNIINIHLAITMIIRKDKRISIYIKLVAKAKAKTIFSYILFDIDAIRKRDEWRAH